MNDHAKTPADDARAELAAAGIIVVPARAAAARRRRLDVVAAWPRGRTHAVRLRVRAMMRSEQPPGDATHHTAA